MKGECRTHVDTASNALSSARTGAGESNGWNGCGDSVAVIIPTLNSGPHVDAQLAAFAQQALPSSSYLVIDSSSDDDTVERYRAFGAEVVSIERRHFNHGGTRRKAVKLRQNADFIIMMTQDAIPEPESLRRLLTVFDNAKVGMAYARQLPRREAGGIERHARLRNYPPHSEIRSLHDRTRLGVKTVFCSDSCSAYRRIALEDVGNFPKDAYFAEDQIVAGQMLLKDWDLAYVGDAAVVHSHGYTVEEDFRRYFDVGVYHARNRWLLDSFGNAEGEGLRFLGSELAYLLKEEPLSIPSAIVRTFAKYAGYRLGRLESRLSLSMKKRFSMQPFYWKQKEVAEADT